MVRGMVARAARTPRLNHCSYNSPIDERPVHLDLKKDRGLTVQWPDGTSDFFSIALLRKMSPSAEARQLREEMSHNPLTVLPANFGGSPGGGPLTALDAELVGHYAIKIRFSDGHDTGIFSWTYLRDLAKRSPLDAKPKQVGGPES
jgi:DUF971 family protein